MVRVIHNHVYLPKRTKDAASKDKFVLVSRTGKFELSRGAGGADEGNWVVEDTSTGRMKFFGSRGMAETYIKNQTMAMADASTIPELQKEIESLQKQLWTKGGAPTGAARIDLNMRLENLQKELREKTASLEQQRRSGYVYRRPFRRDSPQEEVPAQWRLLIVERLEFLRNKLALLPRTDEDGRAAVRSKIEEFERRLAEADLEEETRRLMSIK